jgi:nucleotide-binding universal stress UspA family protein
LEGKQLIMKHILVLTDFSEVSECAVQSAYNLAQSHQASLSIYHGVNQKSEVSFDLNDQLGSEVNKELHIHIQAWKEKASRDGVDAKYILGSDHLVEKIKAIDHKEPIDLIVMGATGKGKSTSVWGSTTQKMIKQLQHPILVTRNKALDIPPRDVVFASAFNPDDKALLIKSLDILNISEETTVQLLAINTLSYFTQPTVLMKAVMKDFSKMIEPIKSVRHFYSDYSVDAGIRHYLDNHPADMLIMYNDQSKSFKKMFTESNTMKAVNRINLPILAIR